MKRTLAVLAAAAGLIGLGALPAAADAPDRPAVLHPGEAADSSWLLRGSLSAGPPTIQFTYGPPVNSLPTFWLFGDWDGDGVATPGIARYDPAGLVWSLRNSNSSGPADIHPFAYGGLQDRPIVGDWDGDGKDTVGVVRPGAADTDPVQWILRNANSTGAAAARFTYGTHRDVTYAVVGDWDGNGTDTVGYVHREFMETLHWRLREANSAGAPTRTFDYGDQNDAPVVGNWDGAGGDGAGITRRSAGQWLWKLRQTPTAGTAQYSFLYGKDTELPLVW